MNIEYYKSKAAGPHVLLVAKVLVCRDHDVKTFGIDLRKQLTVFQPSKAWLSYMANLIARQPARDPNSRRQRSSSKEMKAYSRLGLCCLPFKYHEGLFTGNRGKALQESF